MSKPLILELKEKVQGRSIITISAGRKEVYVSTSWATTEYTADSAVKKGENLTFENGRVKIGAGISKVKISAHCTGIGHFGADGDKNFIITKNNKEQTIAYQSKGATTGYLAIDITPILIEVQEGDVISLAITSGGTGTVNLLNSYLTVEEI